MAEAPSLLAVAPDSFGNLVAFLALDDRARLAATCRQCKENEQTVAHARSRGTRVDQLVGAARAWLESAVDPYAIRRDEDDGFLMVLRELDSAGKWEASALLRIVPLVAPRCDKSPPISSNPQAWCLRSRGERQFRPLAIRWFCTLNVEELARGAAERLVMAGPQALDVEMTLHPESYPEANYAEACQRECEAIFILGILGRAAMPYVTILLSKLLPQLNTDEEDEILSQDSCWEDILLDRVSPSCSGKIVIDSLASLEPSMNDSDVALVASILGHYIIKREERQEEGRNLCIVIAILALSKLGRRLRDHCVVNTIMGLIPLSELGETNSLNEAAVCHFVGAVGLPQYLDYPLKGMGIETMQLSDAAADSLRLLSPMLDRAQHFKMVDAVFELASGDTNLLASGDKQTKDGALGLLADLANNSHGRTVGREFRR